MSETNPSTGRIYVAGAMSSQPDFNFPTFYAASAQLEQQGWTVLNPAQLDIDAGFSLERLKSLTEEEFQEFLRGAMKRDLEAIQSCDAIAMLPGWHKSKGARAEHAVAEWMGLSVIYLDGSETEVATHRSDDPKGAAGALKVPMWLLPPSALRETAWTHKHGADKYGPYNWRKTGVCATTYISAMMRHLDQWRDGEDTDADSGRSHLASIAASCNILMDAAQCGTLNDDRQKLK